jgi:hypothetical protein
VPRTASHWRYVIDNVIVYRDVYRAFCNDSPTRATFEFDSKIRSFPDSPECHSDPASRGSVDRRQLLRRIDRAWRDFQDSHAGLSNEQMLEPGVTGAWSVRDIIAHVTTWDEEALKHLPLVLKGGKPPRYSLTYGGIDAFNARVTEQKKDLSLPEVLRQMNDTHRRVLNLIESAPESQLKGETRFRHRLRLDTYGHYPKHAQAIRKWREKKAED